MNTEGRSTEGIHHEPGASGFVGANDEQRAGLSDQFAAARRLAMSRGFTNVTLAVVPHEDHNPMPARVFVYLDSLRLRP